MKVPCKDCEKRQLGCHSTCEDYKEFSKYCAEKNAFLRNTKVNEMGYAMAKRERLKKYRNN